MIYKYTVASASPVTIMAEMLSHGSMHDGNRRELQDVRWICHHCRPQAAGCRGAEAFGAGLWAALGGRPSFLAGELAARVPALVPRP